MFKLRSFFLHGNKALIQVEINRGYSFSLLKKHFKDEILKGLKQQKEKVQSMFSTNFFSEFIISAQVVELVDTRDLKSLEGNFVPVRVRPWAPA